MIYYRISWRERAWTAGLLATSAFHLASTLTTSIRSCWRAVRPPRINLFEPILWRMTLTRIAVSVTFKHLFSLFWFILLIIRYNNVPPGKKNKQFQLCINSCWVTYKLTSFYSKCQRVFCFLTFFTYVHSGNGYVTTSIVPPTDFDCYFENYLSFLFLIKPSNRFSYLPNSNKQAVKLNRIIVLLAYFPQSMTVIWFYKLLLFLEMNYRVTVNISASMESTSHGGDVGRLWMVLVSKNGAHSDRVPLEEHAG